VLMRINGFVNAIQSFHTPGGHGHYIESRSSL
jgi:hypothetical protein